MMKIVLKYNSIKEIIKEAPTDTHHENNTHTQNRPIGCDGMPLTNAQCHMVTIWR